MAEHSGATGGSGGSSGGSVGSRPSNRRSSGTGSRPNKRSQEGPGAASLCTFRLGEQRWGLSAAYVGELIEVTRLTRVPVAARPILGLFNRRGEPLPLIDLRMVLGLSDTPITVGTAKLIVMVIHAERFSLGVAIDAMEAVMPRTDLLKTSDENPLVLGFLPTSGAGSAPIAVLNPAELMARLERLKAT